MTESLIYLVHDIKKIDLSHDVNKRQQTKVLTHAKRAQFCFYATNLRVNLNAYITLTRM